MAINLSGIEIQALRRVVQRAAEPGVLLLGEQANLVDENNFRRKFGAMPISVPDPDYDELHGPFCNRYEKMQGERVYCGMPKNHQGECEYVRGFGEGV